MFKAYPWDNLQTRINGKIPAIPGPIKRTLSDAVALRNKIVHVGAVKLDAGTLDSVVSSVRELLYFLDALCGQAWALGHVTEATLKQFA
jgi:hypothetical protein